TVFNVSEPMPKKTMKMVITQLTVAALRPNSAAIVGVETLNTVSFSTAKKIRNESQRTRGWRGPWTVMLGCLGNGEARIVAMPPGPVSKELFQDAGRLTGSQALGINGAGTRDRTDCRQGLAPPQQPSHNHNK